MRQVNIHEAKTHLSRLLDGVAQGQEFVIAKAGTPIARVIRYAKASQAPPKRLGFLQGRFGDPAAVKDVGKEEIIALFEGKG
jgi:prevent-host-death family protein